MTGVAELMEEKTSARAPSVAGRSGEAYRFAREIVTLSDQEGSRAEALRTLRTHLMAKHVDDGRRGLAVCAASAGVGTTFTAVNLAVAMAQVGLKTLLIDGDLRRPRVDTYIHPPQPVPGMLQYLEDESSDLSNHIQHEPMENLSVLFAGGVAPNAQELLATDRFAQMVERCLRDYELTIIDTPPASACADGRRISTVVGYSLVVAKRHESFISDIKALTAQLREDRAQVIGTVMIEAGA